MDIGPGEILEAEGRQKGEPRSGVGEPFTLPLGAVAKRLGDQMSLLHKKSPANLPSFFVEHRRIELLTF